MVSADQQTLIQLYSAKLKTVAHDIDAHAMQIIKRLKDAKFEAYLVGGGVRDLLVSMKPKDFDIATSASPNEVRKKVPYSFIIGRRFKLVHAKRGEQIYEIATFRRAATTEELQTTEEEDRRLVEENFFGNIEEDSFRRDFTINSLYYDPIDHAIVDHCNGLSDIYSRTLRMIGNPKERLSEDPIRILRAIRLSQKLNFTIEQSLRTEILNSKNELKRAVLPRCREEWIKFFRLKNTDLALMELFDLSVFEILIPTFHKMFSDEKQKDDFLCYIRNLKHLDFDLSDPVELFSGILTAYLKAVRPDASFNIPQLSENETFLVFCRDELGVFKAELAIVFQALHFINLLKKIDAYMKKGDRRQRSVVFHTTFLLTVKLGLLSGELSQYEYTFWMNEREKYMLAEKLN